MATPVKLGVLQKRASKGIIKGWKPRFCALMSNGTLTYHVAEGQPARGSTTISGVNEAPAKVGKPHGFTVAGSKELLFAASTSQEHDEWVQAIQRVLRGESNQPSAEPTQAAAQQQQQPLAEQQRLEQQQAEQHRQQQQQQEAQLKQQQQELEQQRKLVTEQKQQQEQQLQQATSQQAAAEKQQAQQAPAATETAAQPAKKATTAAAAAAQPAKSPGKQQQQQQQQQQATAAPASRLAPRKKSTTGSLNLQKTAHPSLKRFSVQPKERLRGELKTIRLFLSSTFVDTHGERDMIVKKVIPALNKEFASRDVQIVPVDLRWGVSAEESTPQTIQKTCLNEINRCVTEAGERPWFLGLRSERYGWVQEEWNKPEEFDHPDTFGWMQQALRDHPHGLSITSMEVWHAVLGNNGTGDQPHAFFAFRDPAFAKDVDPDWQWLFDFEYKPENASIPDSVKMQYAKTPMYQKYRDDLDTITKQIRDAQDKCVFFDYAPKGEVITNQTGQLPNGKRFGTGSVQDLDDFAQEVFSMLWTAIDAEYPSYDQEISSAALNDVQHELMARSRRENFVGQAKPLAELSKYVSQKAESTTPLVLTGAAGIGKSALLSKFCQQLEDAGTPVVKHFVGTNPQSFSLAGTLGRLCGGLAQYVVGGFYNYNIPTTSAAGRPELARLVDLANAKRKPDERVVVVIDGVNQLHAEDDALSMTWLPAKLPAHVRIIVSLTPESACHKAVFQLSPKPKELILEPLSKEDSRQLVRATLDVYHKKLSEDDSNALLGNQMALLLAKTGSNQPLYLLAALTELVSFGVYEQVTVYLKSIPNQLAELVTFVLDRLEKEHGQELVSLALSIIMVAVDGILETELTSLLASHEFKTKQVSDFARLFNSIKLFVTAGGSGVLRIFHAPVKAVVSQRYLSNPAQEKAVVELLAQYYRELADPTGDERWNGDDGRGFSQLTLYLAKVATEELQRVLLQPKFIYKKAALCQLDLLLEDFQTPGMSALLCTVGQTLVESAAAISQEPEQVLFQLAARLYEIEDPDVVAFLARCREVSPVVAAVNHGCLNQSSLVPAGTLPASNGAGADGAAAAGGDDEFSFNPPKDGVILSSALSFPTPGPPSDISLANDGTIFCAGMLSFCTFNKDSLKKTLDKNLVSDASQMQYIYRTAITADGKMAITAPGGTFMMQSPNPPCMKFWDLGTGGLIDQNTEHPKPINAIKIVGDQIFTGCADGSIRIFSLASRKMTSSFPAHDAAGGVGALIILGENIISGGYDNKLVRWQFDGTRVQALENVFTNPEYGQPPTEYTPLYVTASPRQDIVLTIGQITQPIKAFKAADLTLLNSYEFSGEYVQACACLSDSQHVALAVTTSVVIQNFLTGQTVRTLEAAGVSAVAATRNMCVITASQSDNISIWGVSVSPNAAAANQGPTSSLELGEECRSLMDSTADGTSFIALGYEKPALEVACNNASTIQTIPADEYGGYGGVRTWASTTGSFTDGTMVIAGEKQLRIITSTATGFTGGTSVALPAECTSINNVGDLLAVSLESGDIWVVNKSMNVKHKLKGVNNKKTTWVASCGDQHLLSVGEHQTLQYWTLSSGKGKDIELPLEKNTTSSFVFACDDNKLAVVVAFQKLHLIDLATGKRVLEKTSEQNHSIQKAAVSPDATRLATRGPSRSIVIWSLPDLTPILTLIADFDVSAIAFTRSGHLVYAGGKKGRIAVLQPTTIPTEAPSRWSTRPDPYAKKKDEGPKTIASKSESPEVAFKTAASEGKLDVCKKLFAAGGIDINSADMEYHFTALMGAAREHPAVVKWLLDNGADASLGDSSGYTALTHAAMAGNMESLKILVKHGANVSQLSKTGLSPLYLSISCQKFAASTYLIENGADVNQACMGMTPLDLLKSYEYQVNEMQMIPMNVWKDMITLLNKKGAKLNDGSKWSPGK